MSTVLEVAIGLVFMYLLLSLMTATVQELIATIFDFRARTLYDAIEGMLRDPVNAIDARVANEAKAAGPNDKRLVDLLYDHPLIKNLGRPPWWRFKRLPSYIPSKTLALALLDVLRGDTPMTDALGARAVLLHARETVDKITNNERLKRALLLLIDDACEAGETLDKRAERISRNIETWFNDRMARVSGWYKRKAQIWSLALALVAAAAFNADSINVVERLWQDGARRAAVVAVAQAYHDAHSGSSGAPPASVSELAKSAIAQAEELGTSGLPVGWSLEANPNRNEQAQVASWLKWPLRILGWILTALAVSLGAGFWFDILGKVLQLRGTGAKVSSLNGKAVVRDA